MYFPTMVRTNQDSVTQYHSGFIPLNSIYQKTLQSIIRSKSLFDPDVTDFFSSSEIFTIP